VGRRTRGSSAAVENGPEQQDPPGYPQERPMSGEELLNDSPFGGDLDAELAAAPKRSRLPGPTLYLGAGVLAVLGFLGGIQADKSWGGSAGSGTTTRAGAPAGLSFGNRSGGTGVGAGATTGTVEKIVGNTIYLKTAAGTTVKVTTGGSTKVTVAKSGSAKDLKSGSTITVQGSAGSDGSVTATAITQGGATTGTGGGGGMPGGGGGGTG
jgi:hypothetical protein